MKKLFLFAWLLLGVQQVALAQNTKHQIVFQLVTSDTMAHKAFMKQLITSTQFLQNKSN